MSNINNFNNIELFTRKQKLLRCKDKFTNKQLNSLNHDLESNNLSQFDSSFKLYKQINEITNSTHEQIDKDEDIQDNIKINANQIEMLNHKLNLALKDLKNQRLTINELLSEKEMLVSEKEMLVSEKASLIEMSKELSDKIMSLNKENEGLKSKIQQDRIDDKIPGYVKGVKEKLQQDDKYFSNLSYNWARTGLLLGVLAVISAFITFFLKIDIKNTSLIEMLYYFVRGILGVGLLSWLSFYALNNSKKFTHESIIRKDRQHALMFGEVFLQIYGSTSNKEDAINVFKDWNMSAKSAFSDPITQPPTALSILSMLKSKESFKDSVKTKE